MRLQRVSAISFGTLSGREFEFGEEVTVVLGPNEAGKTTFYSAIQTLLYGFDPASRDQHPLAQWEEDVTLHLEGEFRPDAGEPFAVERRLMSNASLRVGAPDGLSDSKWDRSNAALHHIASIPRELYRSVYSLEAGATLNLKDGVKEHIDELLLGETGLEGARPLHEVRAALDSEHKALWRSDGRGKDRAKSLNKEIKAAKRAYKEARDARDDRRSAEVELTEKKVAREAMVAKRNALRLAQENAKFALSRAELEERRAKLQVQDPGWLEQAPVRDPAKIAADLKALNTKLAGPRTRLARAALETNAADQVLANRAADLKPCLERRADRKSLEARRSDLKQAAREAVADATTALSSLAANPDMATVQALPLGLLKEEAKRWREAGNGSAPSSPGLVIGLAAVGLVMALATAIPGAPAVLAIGALLTIPALLRLLKPADVTVETRTDEVHAALEPLGLEPRDAAELESMLRELEVAQKSLNKARKDGDKDRDLREQLESSEAADRELIASFDVEPTGEISALLDQVQQRIDDAQSSWKAATEDHAEREQAEAVIRANADVLAALELEMASAQAFLRKGWPNHPELADAWAEWKLEQKERQLVEALEQSLRSDPRFETIEASHEAVQDFESDQVSLDDAVSDTDREIQRLQGLVDSNPDEVTLRHEDLLALEQEMEDVRRERDRLKLLDTILVEAESTHRDAHQPPVLNSASQYLMTITGGRYGGLDYVDGPTGNLSVRFLETGERIPVGEPLSRGTQEQIYVCLRLGTLDYLDKDRETLPLVLDEALVHWDEDRRLELYPLLSEISKHRQVILFTCHTSFALEAREKIGARVVDLLGAPPTDAEPDAVESVQILEPVKKAEPASEPGVESESAAPSTESLFE